MSRWFRALLWVQAISLLSPFTWFVAEASALHRSGCGQENCSVLGMLLALALLVLGPPLALVIIYAFDARRLTAWNLVWLLAVDAWLVLMSSVSIGLIGDPLAVTCAALVIALAGLTAIGSALEWVRYRRLQAYDHYHGSD